MVESGHRYRSGAFAPLRSRGLRSEALLSIRRAIVTGVLHPGDRLMEADIAREMGISRGPVREALRQLEQEGLVISYPHRGTFVASLAADEVSEIYVMRSVLEGLAARRAASHVSGADADQLHRLVQEMGEAARARDAAQLVEKDVEFHELICHLSNHQALLRIWACIDGLMRSYMAWSSSMDDERMTRIAHAHAQLAEALLAGDPDRAEKAARKHVERALAEMESVGRPAATPDEARRKPTATPGQEEVPSTTVAGADG